MKALYTPLIVLFVALAFTTTTLAQPCGNNSKKGLSAPCATCLCPGANYFEPYTGNVQREMKDLELWGSVGELPMTWSHIYTSRGNILWNYSFVYAMYDGPVVGGQPSIVIDYPEGGQNSFFRNPSNSSEWLPPAGIDRRITQSGIDYFLQMATGFIYHFQKFSIVIGPNTYFYYLLVDIRDSKQNVYTLTYTVNRQLSRVTEPGGRYFQVSYTIVGGRSLIGQVSTSDGRSVVYSYDIFNDGVSKWIRFLGAAYGDGTQSTYTYVQQVPGRTLRLGHAVDPRFQGPANNIIFTYDWYTAAGYVYEEKNGITGQVMSTLTATDSSRTVCYAN